MTKQLTTPFFSMIKLLKMDFSELHRGLYFVQVAANGKTLSKSKIAVIPEL